MVEAIFDPNYWKERLEARKVSDHHSIYLCSIEEWEEIAEFHQNILKRIIRPEDSILDVGCGWGRLLELLPSNWKGVYQGYDISPEFIQLARNKYPMRYFSCKNILKADETWGMLPFDWAICISMRDMITDNAGKEAWEAILAKIKKWATNVLILEYSLKGGEIL